MNILILEDDLTQLEILHKMLKTRWSDFHYTCCDSYKSAHTAIALKKYDILILDIRLSQTENDFNGIHFASYLRSLPAYRTTPILFITCITHKMQMCINKLHCYSYIEKPYNQDMVINAVSSIITNQTDHSQRNCLTIKLLNDVNTHISFSDILYIEVKGHNLIFVCLEDRFTSSSYSLTSVSELLPAYFLRCHRKFILNANFMTNYDKTNLYINIKSQSIPIGRSFKKTFEKQLENLTL